MPIKLTPLGEETVAKLCVPVTTAVTACVPPRKDFKVMLRSEGWTLANDALLVMASNTFDPRSDNPLIVGQYLADAMGIPPALADELVQALHDQGYIEQLPLERDRQMVWMNNIFTDVFSHEQRLRLFVVLRESLENKELCTALGDLPMTTMRHHLDILRGYNFIEYGRGGRKMTYSLCRPMLYVFIRRFSRLILGEEYE